MAATRNSDTRRLQNYRQRAAPTEPSVAPVALPPHTVRRAPRAARLGRLLRALLETHSALFGRLVATRLRWGPSTVRRCYTTLGYIAHWPCNLLLFSAAQKNQEQNLMPSMRLQSSSGQEGSPSHAAQCLQCNRSPSPSLPMLKS